MGWDSVVPPGKWADEVRRKACSAAGRRVTTGINGAFKALAKGDCAGAESKRLHAELDLAGVGAVCGPCGQEKAQPAKVRMRQLAAQTWACWRGP